MGEQTPANTSTGGQAPAEGQGQAPTTGQQPQVGATTTPQPSSSAPQTQQPQAGGALTTEQVQAELARVQRELTEARKEAAGHRTKLKTFEDAQLTEQQKLEKRATDAEAQLTTYQQRIASYEVKLAASALGIIDPDLAALAIRDQLEYEPDGTPKNAEKLLKDLLVAKPYLGGGAVAQGQGQQANAQGQQQRPAASSGGATNPGAGARTGVFTRESIGKMSVAEYARNQEAIYEAMKNGQIK